uniref:Uncharacterized protein n=1 Tax=Anguilla anguilla TaxID=7936 RepID=A0A0E9P6J7_ANGAN
MRLYDTLFCVENYCYFLHTCFLSTQITHITEQKYK